MYSAFPLVNVCAHDPKKWIIPFVFALNLGQIIGGKMTGQMNVGIVVSRKKLLSPCFHEFLNHSGSSIYEPVSEAPSSLGRWTLSFQWMTCLLKLWSYESTQMKKVIWTKVVHWLWRKIIGFFNFSLYSILELVTFAGEEEHIQDIIYFQALQHVLKTKSKGGKGWEIHWKNTSLVWTYWIQKPFLLGPAPCLNSTVELTLPTK